MQITIPRAGGSTWRKHAKQVHLNALFDWYRREAGDSLSLRLDSTRSHPAASKVR
jgi:hypothetical protein